MSIVTIKPADCAVVIFLAPLRSIVSIQSHSREQVRKGGQNHVSMCTLFEVFNIHNRIEVGTNSRRSINRNAHPGRVGLYMSHASYYLLHMVQELSSVSHRERTQGWRRVQFLYVETSESLMSTRWDYNILSLGRMYSLHSMVTRIPKSRAVSFNFHCYRMEE